MTDVRWQLIAYVFVSMVLWMVAAQLAHHRAGFARIRLLRTGWAASISRFVYYVGLPYAALILGVVPGRYLGLVGLDRLETGPSASLSGLETVPNVWQFLSRIRDAVSLVILAWLPDLSTIAGLAVVMLLLLSVAWLGYGYFKGSVVSSPGIKPPFRPGWKSPSAVQVVYQAIHWSFYRSAAWLLTDDLYLGVIGGILLTGAEWMLDPGWIDRLQHPSLLEEPLIDVSVLIATSAIFFFAPNLWLLIPIHWLLATVSRRMAGSFSAPASVS